MRIRSAVVVGLFLLVSQSLFATTNTMWIAPWDADALTSIQQNGDAIQESNPVWYSWNSDGSIALNWNAESPTLRAAMTGSKLLPTVQNVVDGKFNGAVLSAMLDNPATRETQSVAITQLVLNHSYDGIDIDYEELPYSEKANFTAFVGSLASKLHAAGKQLSVTVYAKTSDNATWTGPGGEDWGALGSMADSIKIMGYDYSYDGGIAGPIAPLAWLDQVAAYAEKTIHSAKIIVGLPFYGYDWSGSSASTVTYSSAMQKAQSNNVTPTRDANGELTFQYAGRTVYFQDAESYSRKVQMLKQNHPQIAGFAHWRAGQEDPAVWNVLRGGTSTSPAAGPPEDFLISGPGSLSVMQGGQASADYSIAPINGFKSTAAVTLLPIGGFDGTVSLTSNALQPGSTVTVRATARLTTRPGSYQLTVRMSSGSLVHDQIVTMTVTPTKSRHRAAV